MSEDMKSNLRIRPAIVMQFFGPEVHIMMFKPIFVGDADSLSY